MPRRLQIYLALICHSPHLLPGPNECAAIACASCLAALGGPSRLAQDAPERLRQEFQLFWDEVEAEAARIERDDEPEVAITAPSADIQDQIDALRARVAAMARRLDQDS